MSVVNLKHVKECEATPPLLTEEERRKFNAQRIAWPGGKISHNKPEAVYKFMRRKADTNKDFTQQDLTAIRNALILSGAGEAKGQVEDKVEARTATFSQGASQTDINAEAIKNLARLEAILRSQASDPTFNASQSPILSEESSGRGKKKESFPRSDKKKRAAEGSAIGTQSTGKVRHNADQSPSKRLNILDRLGPGGANASVHSKNIESLISNGLTATREKLPNSAELADKRSTRQSHERTVPPGRLVESVKKDEVQPDAQVRVFQRRVSYRSTRRDVRVITEGSKPTPPKKRNGVAHPKYDGTNGSRGYVSADAQMHNLKRKTSSQNGKAWTKVSEPKVQSVSVPLGSRLNMSLQDILSKRKQ